MKQLFKQPVLWFVVLGIGLRLIIMASSFHMDLLGQTLSSYFFAYKNITNIYDYLAKLPATDPLVKNFGVADIFIYPPLAYFTLGSFLKAESLVIPEKYFLDLMNKVSIFQPDMWWHLLLLKLPYLFFDLGIAIVLTLIFEKNRDKKLALFLWLFNPITLYATFAMGVFDCIPVFFTVLALYFLKQGKYTMSAAMIGIGTAYKQYPIFLLPFIVLCGKGFWERVKIAAFGLVPYFLTILPYLSSASFKAMVFGPKSQKMFYMEWMLSGAEGLYPYLIFYVLLLVHALKNKNLTKKVWAYFLGYFLILFSVTHFHPQWFIWVSPFIVMEIVINKGRNLFLQLLLFGCYVFIVLTFDNSLSIGLFAPINQGLANFIGIDKILSAKFDIFFLKSSVRSLFAGVSLGLVYDLLTSQKKGYEKKH